MVCFIYKNYAEMQRIYKMMFVDVNEKLTICKRKF